MPERPGAEESQRQKPPFFTRIDRSIRPTSALVFAGMDSLSHAETLELFFSAQELLDAQFQYWLSATIAAIVARFIAGDQLTRKMSYALVLLYFGVTALFTLRYFAVSGTLSIIGAEAASRGIVGDIGRQLTPLLKTIRVTLFLFGMATTVWFLLRTERQSEKA